MSQSFVFPFEDSDLSGLPTTDPGGGRPWLFAGATGHQIVVGAFTASAGGVSQAYVDNAVATRQPLDADLTAIAALSTTAFGRSLLTVTDATSARSTIGLGNLSQSGNTISQVSGTSAQTFAIYRTYTSPTNAEWLEIRGGANAFELITRVGSSGGTSRGINIGFVDSAGVTTYAMQLDSFFGSPTRNLGFNTAIQPSATGSDNVGITSSGGGTFSVLSTGTYNTCVGGRYAQGAGCSITTGNNNTLIGGGAGATVATGSDNTMIGHVAGFGADVANNVYLGALAGFLATGSDNIFIGRGAGQSATGSNRLIVSNSASFNYLDGNLSTGSLQLNSSASTRGDFACRNLNLTGTLRLASYTVATLPSASSAGAGATAYVTDANATTYRSIVAGGGSNALTVFSDGTNWRIG